MVLPEERCSASRGLGNSKAGAVLFQAVGNAIGAYGADCDAGQAGKIVKLCDRRSGEDKFLLATD